MVWQKMTTLAEEKSLILANLSPTTLLKTLEYGSILFYFAFKKNFL
jgi:hypothetical protein